MKDLASVDIFSTWGSVVGISRLSKFADPTSSSVW